ncbi:hypothetical protein vseg_008532 [Gypsophila vaccaria]
MRVLAVDDNVVCLKLLTTLLNKCKYQVTSLRNKSEALEVLKQNVGNFDIVLTDVYIDEIEGFKILELGNELNIPVIMISASESKDIIMKGVRFGVVNYLIKPVRLEALQTIWQHVYRTKIITCPSSTLDCKVVGPIGDGVEGSRGDHGTVEELGIEGGNRAGEEDYKESEGITQTSVGLICSSPLLNYEDFVSSVSDRVEGVLGDYGRSENFGKEFGSLASEADDKEVLGDVETSKSSSEGGKRKSQLGEDGENDGDKGDCSSRTEKKGRIKWSKEPRHEKFLRVVERLGGIEKAVPKKILELMDDPDLIRSQVASHLQKIRNNSKKKGNSCNNTKQNINSSTAANNNNCSIIGGITNNKDNYYPPHMLASASIGPTMAMTPSHQPSLHNTMPQTGFSGYNYQTQPNINHRWIGPPTIGYRPQLEQHQMFMMPNIGNYIGTSPNTAMFQQLPQDGSFGTRLQPPEEVFDHGPSIIDTTFDIPLCSLLDDVVSGYPMPFEFSEDNDKDQIRRMC